MKKNNAMKKIEWMKILRNFSMFSLFSIISFSSFSKTNKPMDNFNYVVDQFADVQVLRYKVPGFEQLSLKQKELIYFLSKAAEQGRDILFDQNYKYNLVIRQTLENIYLNYAGEKESDDYKAFMVYFKRVLFSNGIHHHYGMKKFEPEFSLPFFLEALNQLTDDKLLLQPKQTREQFNELIIPIIFDPNIASKRVNQAVGQDLIVTSANNYYDGVTQHEAEAYYNAMRDTTDQTPVSYGLNSRLVKKDGKLIEETYKLGGKYSAQIEKIIYWLEKAETVAENPQQKEVIHLLIDFYKTGDLKTFDEYSIKWVHDTNSLIDFVNGFIETYGDPLGIKASWESIVNFKNLEATHRTEIISANAQWFEDNSPVKKEYKKPHVKGVSAKVINAAMLGGDCYPATPIGINLPNANWIRQVHGSKSVTIDNITNAYDKASQGTGFNEEFMIGQEEIDRKVKYGKLADDLHTDLHECLGHGSGQLLPGVSQDALKAYGATIEEARADLFGLYYTADKKIVDLGLLPSADAYKAEYYQFMMNGLMTQLVRIEPGHDIEESHMRNRQLIAQWVFQKGSRDKTVELITRDGKTFVKINDYAGLRRLFGQLLAEVQRIKSEGDYEAAKRLVETYGVRVDPVIHKEVLERYQKLNLAPYKGFVNPVYTPVTNAKNEITDIKINYTEGFLDQQLRYDGVK